jgi:hypothetical protein
MTALESLRGLIVIDEVQRRPDLFPILRFLLDGKPVRARFLILGNASPELLRQSSETLRVMLSSIIWFVKRSNTPGTGWLTANCGPVTSAAAMTTRTFFLRWCA